MSLNEYITKKQNFIEKINSFGDRIPRLLQRLSACVKKDEVDENTLKNMASALIMFGDDIEVQHNDGDFFSNDWYQYVYNFLYIILEKLKGNIFSLLEESIKESKSIYMISMLIIGLGKEHGVYNNLGGRGVRSSDDKCTTPEQFEILKQIVLDKIRQYAASQNLLDHPKMHNILHRWKDAAEGNYDEPREWVSKISKEDSNFRKLINGFSHTSYFFTGEKNWSEISFSFDAIENLINLKETCERAKLLFKKEDKFSEQEKIIFEVFITKCTEYLKEKLQ